MFVFLVAILAGACAQLLKVVSYLIIEKRVNYRRFVQTHGAPNMHATAFSALMVSVGLKDGFDSLPFSIAACLTAIILVDTMNVKNATSRQAEAVFQEEHDVQVHSSRLESPTRTLYSRNNIMNECLIE